MTPGDMPARTGNSRKPLCLDEEPRVSNDSEGGESVFARDKPHNTFPILGHQSEDIVIQATRHGPSRLCLYT